MAYSAQLVCGHRIGFRIKAMAVDAIELLFNNVEGVVEVQAASAPRGGRLRKNEGPAYQNGDGTSNNGDCPKRGTSAVDCPHYCDPFGFGATGIAVLR